MWTQDSPGIISDPGVAEGFGGALAAGDFGNDTASGCYDDLAIGLPGYAEHSVSVIYGSASGLTATANQRFQQTSDPFSGYGGILAAGSFRGLDSICGSRKLSDLVIVAPNLTNGTSVNSGAVFVLYATNSGLSLTNSQKWNQNSSGIADKVESGDHFGEAVATGHSKTRGEFLVIGVPFESLVTSTAPVRYAGAIHILYTDPTTGLLTATGSKFYNQDTPGIKDTMEDGDTFGHAVGIGDFNKDGEDGVAIGVPGEDLQGVKDVGAINVLYSAGTATTQFFHQNKEDMKDVEEEGDSFGTVLSH